MKNAPDNELTFQSLAAITSRLLEPTKRQKENAGDDRQSSNRRVEDAKRHRAYIEQRLRDFAAFEARARGKPP